VPINTLLSLSYALNPFNILSEVAATEALKSGIKVARLIFLLLK
jgi:hypothetical protein